MEYLSPDRTIRKELRRQGYTLNMAEFEAANVFKSVNVEYTRRGYPDFMVLKDGEIVGFVEVKPRSTKALRAGQVQFQSMCRRFGIPFLKWSPDDGGEPLAAFARELQ